MTTKLYVWDAVRLYEKLRSVGFDELWTRTSYAEYAMGPSYVHGDGNFIDVERVTLTEGRSSSRVIAFSSKQVKR